MMSDDLSGVQRGDTVFYSDQVGAPRKAEVTAAGPKWITVKGERFSRETGYHVSGISGIRIETVAGHAERIEREQLTVVLRTWGWHPAQSRHKMTTSQLRRAVALIDRFAAEELELQ